MQFLAADCANKLLLADARSRRDGGVLRTAAISSIVYVPCMACSYHHHLACCWQDATSVHDGGDRNTATMTIFLCLLV